MSNAGPEKDIYSGLVLLYASQNICRADIFDYIIHKDLQSRFLRIGYLKSSTVILKDYLGAPFEKSAEMSLAGVETSSGIASGLFRFSFARIVARVVATSEITLIKNGRSSLGTHFAIPQERAVIKATSSHEFIENSILPQTLEFGRQQNISGNPEEQGVSASARASQLLPKRNKFRM